MLVSYDIGQALQFSRPPAMAGAYFDVKHPADAKWEKNCQFMWPSDLVSLLTYPLHQSTHGSTVSPSACRACISERMRPHHLHTRRSST
jgi:hypothetical protein